MADPLVELVVNGVFLEDAGNEDAALALGVYLHRLRAGIASMAAALEGIDAVVFTGGVGERSAAVRQGAAAGLRFLGIELDHTANEAAHPDQEIGVRGAEVKVFVVAGRLSGSRNQAKNWVGPLIPEPSGAGRNENSLYWLPCSR